MAEQRRTTLRLGQLILRAVRRQPNVRGDGPLVLAVSGGADSLAMLLAAATVRQSIGHELVVAHFSHGIRKSAERGEAALVRRIARELGLALEHEQATTGHAEADARDARYAFLARVAGKHGAWAVATAHTRDDQAETLLLRLSRGTGLRGAGAIREFSQRDVQGRPVVLLRPILEAARADTVAVCAEWGVSPASDGTNRSLRYARNRVRKRVLPELGQINPDAAGALAAFAGAAQEDDDLLTTLAAEAVRGSEHRGPKSVTWSAQLLRNLPGPLLVRVLQAAWASIKDDGAALQRTQIASANQVLERGDGSVDLEGGATFAVEHDEASLSTVQTNAVGFEPTALRVPGETLVGPWAITTSVAGVGSPSDSPWRATLDLDALGPELCVRTRADGDRVQPLGMGYEVRLQDLLTNAKIPRSQRGELPLLIAGGKIAWVAGVRIAEWAKITPATTRVVTIETKRAEHG
jgi:tRNA(Ile)-lysidine synthase